MRVAAKVFEPKIFQLRILEQEHAEIRRRFATLEGTLLMGKGMVTVVKAAECLVKIILQHFVHEEKFLEDVSNPILFRQRDASMEMTARLFKIEDELKQSRPSAVLRLLLLTRTWINEHMTVERVTFEREAQTFATPTRTSLRKA